MKQNVSGELIKENLEPVFLSTGSFSQGLFPRDLLTPVALPILSWIFYVFFRYDFFCSSIHSNFKVVYKYQNH